MPDLSDFESIISSSKGPSPEQAESLKPFEDIIMSERAANSSYSPSVDDFEAILKPKEKPTSGFYPAQYQGVNEVWGGIGAGVNALVEASKHPISTLNQIAGDVISGMTGGILTPRTGTLNIGHAGAVGGAAALASEEERSIPQGIKVMEPTEKLQDIEPMVGETLGTMVPWGGISRTLTTGSKLLQGAAPVVTKAVKPVSKIIGEAAERTAIQATTGGTIGAMHPAKDAEQRAENIVKSAEFGAYFSVGGEAALIAGSKIAQGLAKVKDIPAKMKANAFEDLLNEVSDLLYNDPGFRSKGWSKYEADAFARRKVAEDINNRGGWTKTTRRDFKTATENIKKARKAKAEEPIEPEIVQEPMGEDVTGKTSPIDKNVMKDIKKKVEEAREAEKAEEAKLKEVEDAKTVPRDTEGVREEGLIEEGSKDVSSENIQLKEGEGREGNKGETTPQVLAVRQGDVEEGGAYFSTEGSSTYFDLDNPNAKRYDIGSAKLAVSGSNDMRGILKEALNDADNSIDDIQRITDAMVADNAVDNFVDYMLFDEVPSIKRAAEKLGYDGVKVWESDDISDPSSVFIWNTGKAKDIIESGRKGLNEEAIETREGAPESPKQLETDIDRIVKDMDVDSLADDIGRQLEGDIGEPEFVESTATASEYKWPDKLTDRKFTVSKAKQSKEIHRKLIEDLRDSGELPPDSLVRSTTENDIKYVLENKVLRMGKHHETHFVEDTISSSGIDNFGMYGNNFKMNAVIIAPRSAAEGRGSAVNEFYINPGTPVEELKYIVKGKLYNWEELNEAFGKKKTEREIRKDSITKPVTKLKKPKLIPGRVDKTIAKTSAKDFEEITEAMYSSVGEASKALEKLGEKGSKYLVRGNDEFGYMLVHESEMADNITDKEIRKSDLYQEMEEIASVDRTDKSLLNATKMMQADINKFYHTAEGDIVSIGNQLNNILGTIEENPRQFLKDFGGDVISYNAWVDQLHRLAEHLANIEKVRGPGNTLDFMGFQTSYNLLHRNISRWKAKRAFHKSREIRARIDGTDNDITITGEVQKDISSLAKIFTSSRLPMSSNFPQKALDIVIDTIASELRFRYEVDTESQMIDDIANKLTDSQIVELTNMAYEIERYGRVSREVMIRRQKVNKKKAEYAVKSNIEDYLEKYPDQAVVEAYREVRAAYDAWQERYKEHLIRELRRGLPKNIVKAVDDVRTHLDIDKAFKDNSITTSADKAKFYNYLKEVNDINDWGDNEYVTHMMIGNYTVREVVTKIDKNGKAKTSSNVITKAKDIGDAVEKVIAYAREQYDNNRSVGHFTFDTSFAYEGEIPTHLSRRQYIAFKSKINNAIRKAVKEIKADKTLSSKITENLKGVVGMKPPNVFAVPTIKSKHILPGEDDIFVGMRAYSRIMWKKVLYDPVITDLRNSIEGFPPKVRDHLQSVLDRSKGKYDSVDRFLDDALKDLGLETSQAYTRFIVNPGVKSLVFAKLAWRPTAAVFNAADGYAKIWIKYKEHYIKEGIKFLNTPEGEALVAKNAWRLGMKFEAEGGHVKTKQKFLGHKLTGAKAALAPMGLFSMPELPVRKLNYATAYLFYRDLRIQEMVAKGREADTDIISAEADDFAKRAAMVDVWELQGSNTMAERPQILRSPTGRLFGTFMPFFVRNTEFILANSRSFGFWARYIPYQLMMAGPRGFVQFVKSIPLIEVALAICGVSYFWEKLEKWMIENLPLSGGLPSAVGADTVAPATAQLPSSSTLIDTSIKIWKYGLSQVGNPNARYETKEGLKNTVIFARNWLDVVDSMIDKDGYVMGADGRPKYSITSNWDRTMMAMGITPESKTLANLTHRSILLDKQRQEKRAKEIVEKFTNQLQDFHRRGADTNTVLPKVIETAKQAILEYHVRPEAIQNAIADHRMSRSMRDITQSSLIDRLDVYEAVQGVEKRFPGTLFPKQKEN
jgi:hypothetical protein